MRGGLGAEWALAWTAEESLQEPCECCERCREQECSPPSEELLGNGRALVEN